MKKLMVSADIFAILDDEDYIRLRLLTWHVDYRKNGDVNRVRRNIRYDDKWQMISMHHEVIGKPDEGLVVDHINRNPLDNRKENLRFVTKKQNSENRKDYAGRINSVNNLFVARLTYQSKYDAELAVKRYYQEEENRYEGSLGFYPLCLPC